MAANVRTPGFVYCYTDHQGTEHTRHYTSNLCVLCMGRFRLDCGAAATMSLKMSGGFECTDFRLRLHIKIIGER